MNVGLFWVVVFIILSLSGYVVAYLQWQKKLKAYRDVSLDAIKKIRKLGEDADEVLMEKTITKDELKKSKDRVEKILKTMETREKEDMDLDEAMDIIWKDK